MTTEVAEDVIPEVPEPEPITLLETWRELLKSIDTTRDEPIGPAEASRILQKWPNLKVQELSLHKAWFYDYLSTMHSILLLELAQDPAALQHIEDDAVDNHHHYLNLIMQWQLQLQHWTSSWDSDAKDAHITMAALAETQQFFFGPNGMSNHLDQIQFEFTEDDATLVAEALESMGGSGE